MKTEAPLLARRRLKNSAVGMMNEPVSPESSMADCARIYRSAPAERITMIRQGVPAGEVVNLARMIGRPKERLFQVLGLPRATVDRKARAAQRLSTEQGERVIGFAKLVGQVQVMVEQSGQPQDFGAARWLADWLDRPLPALGGQCPADYLDTVEGQEFVAGLLAKMCSGAYA